MHIVFYIDYSTGSLEISTSRNESIKAGEPFIYFSEGEDIVVLCAGAG